MSSVLLDGHTWLVNELQWRIQGGVRGVQMHPPFEGLPSRVLK